MWTPAGFFPLYNSGRISTGREGGDVDSFLVVSSNSNHASTFPASSNIPTHLWKHKPGDTSAGTQTPPSLMTVIQCGHLFLTQILVNSEVHTPPRSWTMTQSRVRVEVAVTVGIVSSWWAVWTACFSQNTANYLNHVTNLPKCSEWQVQWPSLSCRMKRGEGTHHLLSHFPNKELALCHFRSMSLETCNIFRSMFLMSKPTTYNCRNFGSYSKAGTKNASIGIFWSFRFDINCAEAWS